MPVYKHNFFSIVLLGSHNPQILNHDFLINNKILPQEEEPFKTLLDGEKKGKKPFNEFLSTPPVTSIRYKWISIIVDQNRYQIKDDSKKTSYESPIIQITKEYFGKYLKYTPFILGGLNFHGELLFHDGEDQISFDSKMGIDSSRLAISHESYPEFDIRIKLPWNDGKIEIRKSKDPIDKLKGAFNFNYEFKYEDIDSFMNKLDDVSVAYKKCADILESLGVEEEYE